MMSYPSSVIFCLLVFILTTLFAECLRWRLFYRLKSEKPDNPTDSFFFSLVSIASLIQLIVYSI
jgi:hypothetical protein